MVLQVIKLRRCSVLDLLSFCVQRQRVPESFVFCPMLTLFTAIAEVYFTHFGERTKCDTFQLWRMVELYCYFTLHCRVFGLRNAMCRYVVRGDGCESGVGVCVYDALHIRSSHSNRSGVICVSSNIFYDRNSIAAHNLYLYKHEHSHAMTHDD